MRWLLIVALWVAAASADTLWPIPISVQLKGSPVSISKDFNITSSNNSILLHQAITRYLQIFKNSIRAGAKLFENEKSKRSIDQLLHSLEVSTVSGEERLDSNTSYEYWINVQNMKASVVGQSVYGAIYGLETFSQLIVNGSLLYSTVSVHDKPDYHHRGLMIDTGRRFFPVTLVYNLLDAMSYLKMNVLHFHLSDYCRFSIQSVKIIHVSKNGRIQEVYIPHMTSQSMLKLLGYKKVVLSTLGITFWILKMNESEDGSEPLPKKACSESNSSYSSQEMRHDVVSPYSKRSIKKKSRNTGGNLSSSRQAMMQDVELNQAGESNSKRSGKQKMGVAGNSSSKKLAMVQEVDGYHACECDSKKSGKKHVHWDPQTVESLEELLTRVVNELRSVVRGQQEIQKELRCVHDSMVKELRVLCHTVKDCLQPRIKQPCIQFPFSDLAARKRDSSRFDQSTAQNLPSTPHAVTVDNSESSVEVTSKLSELLQLPSHYSSSSSSSSSSSTLTQSITSSISSSSSGEQSGSSNKEELTRLAVQFASSIIGDEVLSSVRNGAGGIQCLPPEKLNELRAKVQEQRGNEEFEALWQHCRTLIAQKCKNSRKRDSKS